MIMNGKGGALSLITGVALSVAACGPGLPTPDEAEAIAIEVYVYGLPMVLGYKTMNTFSVDQNSPEYKAPFNQLACVAGLATPEDRAVVTPNADTPYCMSWMDLRVPPAIEKVR